MTEAPPPDDPLARRVPAGARANALDAGAFVPLLAIDPRVADALLESLEDAGIGAWSQPVEGERSGYLDVRPPRDLQEQLYVDASRRDLAAQVVAAELPGLLAELVEPDPDAAFRAIVAGWDAGDHDGPVAPWPVQEDAGPDVPDAADDDAEVVPISVARRDDDEGHYIPPPPPPAPIPEGPARWAWAAMVGGLLALVGLPLIGVGTSGRTQTLAVLAIVGGIGTLVWRMRDAPSVDDGPDDGAVV